MTKRILSVLLALVLVLGLSTVALAEQQFTLTIKDAADNRTYEAYQVFDGDYSKNEDGQDVLSSIVWGSGVTPEADGTINGKTATEWEADLSADKITAKDFADMISLHLSTTKTPSVPGDDVYTFTLDAGYYFVKETTVLASEDDAASAFILNVVKTTEVSTKRSDVPVVKKTQSDATATYDVGESITFTLTSAIPTNNYDQYDKYYFQFKDTMSAGLTYVGNAKVTVGGVESSAFTFEQDGQVLTWTCADTVAAKIPAGAEIVVTYTAKLNDKAVSKVAETNTVIVIYSNNPESDGTGETTPDTELVFMIDLNGLKVDGSDKTTTLAGAKFVLKNADKKYYSVDADGNVSWNATYTDNDVVTTPDNGTFSFDGLAAGTYYLEEIAAPVGYNKLTTDITIVISSSKDDNGNVTFSTTSTGVIVNEKGALVTVENNAGTTLPSTGGIGTTLFYVIGGLLMAFAVVLLVAKKRTVNE